MSEIEAAAFARKVRKGALGDAVLLDVREAEEWDVYRLEQAKLIPLGTLPDNLSQLDPQKLTYVYCAHGVRSRYAVDFLYKAGFKQIVNVNDGLATVFHYLEQGEAETD